MQSIRFSHDGTLSTLSNEVFKSFVMSWEANEDIRLSMFCNLIDTKICNIKEILSGWEEAHEMFIINDL